MKLIYIGPRELKLEYPFNNMFMRNNAGRTCRNGYDKISLLNTVMGEPWNEKDWCIRQGGIPIEIYIEEANCGGYIP